MSAQDVIRDRVAVAPDGCWIWTLFTDRDGYGKLKVAGKCKTAHRFSYEAFRGPIPSGKVLDHVVCDQPSCANPWHVEPRTNWENVARGGAWSAVNARKTHCAHNHEFTPENTYLYRGGRHCKTCRSLRQKGGLT